MGYCVGIILAKTLCLETTCSSCFLGAHRARARSFLARALKLQKNYRACFHLLGLNASVLSAASGTHTHAFFHSFMKAARMYRSVLCLIVFFLFASTFSGMITLSKQTLKFSNSTDLEVLKPKNYEGLHA